MGLDLYKVLGVSEDASLQEIKAAYRKAVFQHHPDTNPDVGRAELKRFHEVQEAYRVLRDEDRRRQYDAMRAAGFGGEDFEDAAAGTGRPSTPWGQPGVDERDFDARFDEWWKKMSADFADYEERQYAQRRMNAERMAKAAAWEYEKQQAQENKGRAQRLKWRTEDARMQRHATVLRRFWQTSGRFTLGDALFVGLFMAGAAGIALAWRPQLEALRQQEQAVHAPLAQQEQQQHVQQQPVVQAPSLPAAAAVAAAAAAAQS